MPPLCHFWFDKLHRYNLKPFVRFKRPDDQDYNYGWHKWQLLNIFVIISLAGYKVRIESQYCVCLVKSIILIVHGKPTCYL
jgi:hypothetical protein